MKLVRMTMNPLRMNLQLFGGEDDNLLSNPDGEDVNDIDDVDELQDDDSQDDDLLEDEGVNKDDDVDSNEPDDDANLDDNAQVTFTEEQQNEVNNIVQARLDRQVRTQLRELREAAGTEITAEEIPRSASLWGLLKTNPELNAAVSQVIGQYLDNGRATAPTDATTSKESRLEVREAILDLKIADPMFNKYSAEILEWAEEQGYEITSPKGLKMMYLAWKGSQGRLQQANERVAQQRKNAKQKARRRANTQSTKSGKSRGRTDYRKMSDRDILAAENLQLFTPEG